MPPQCCGASSLPGSARKSGSSASAKLILQPVPIVRQGGDLRSDFRLRRLLRALDAEGRLWIGIGEHEVGRDLLAIVEHDAGHPAVADRDLGDRRREADRRRHSSASDRASASVTAPMPPSAIAQQPNRPSSSEAA